MSSASGVPQSTTNELSVGSQAWTRADMDLESLDAVESSVGLASGNQSYYLIGASLTSLGVPGTATIDGVEITIYRRVSNAGGGLYPTIKDASIRVYDGSTFVGADKADTATAWPTAVTAATYGGPTDAWSLSSSSWQAILSGAPLSWGIAISASASGGASPATAYVDAVSVTIYYTSAVTGASFQATRFVYVGDVEEEPEPPAVVFTPTSRWVAPTPSIYAAPACSIGAIHDEDEESSAVFAFFAGTAGLATPVTPVRPLVAYVGPRDDDADSWEAIVTRITPTSITVHECCGPGLASLVSRGYGVALVARAQNSSGTNWGVASIVSRGYGVAQVIRICEC